MAARTRAYRNRRLAWRFVAPAVCLMFWAILPAEARQSPAAPGQSPAPQQSSTAPPTSAGTSSNAAEMNTRDATIPLQSRVNVVPLRVVVRDAKGQPVPNLRKEDFQLFEDGKLQDISHFSVETPASAPQIVRDDAVVPGAKATADFVPPSRFVALLFDDVHVTMQDLMRARNAAKTFIGSAVQPTDRVAVYTVSGQSQMDFTADREKLQQALAGLMVRPVGAAAGDSNDPRQ